MTQLQPSLDMDYATLAPPERRSRVFPAVAAFARGLLAAMMESRRRQAVAELARHPHLMDGAGRGGAQP